MRQSGWLILLSENKKDAIMRKENTLGIAHGKDDNNGCHQTDVSHCEKCGIELTRNDIREYGGLCWSCWRREYG